MVEFPYGEVDQSLLMDLLVLIPTSDPLLVQQKPWYVLSYLFHKSIPKLQTGFQYIFEIEIQSFISIGPGVQSEIKQTYGGNRVAVRKQSVITYYCTATSNDFICFQATQF